MSQNELKLYGWELSKKAPKDIADKDFFYDKNLGIEKLEILYKERVSEVVKNFIKLAAINSAAKFQKNVQNFHKEQELYVWQKSLDAMVDEVLVKENQKYPINFIQVEKMNEKTRKFLEKLDLEDLQNLHFILSKNNLLHAAPKRKSKYNQALSMEEIKQIVKVLDEAKELYWDTKEQSLVYFLMI